MLQHMSPPSSPGDDAPSRKPPVPSGTNTQQQLTSLSVPGKTKHPDAGAEGDNQGGHEDGRGLDDLALSPVASVDGLPSEEGGGVGGEVKREQKRPSELATLRLEKETQVRTEPSVDIDRRSLGFPSKPRRFGSSGAATLLFNGVHVELSDGKTLLQFVEGSTA